MSYIFNYSYTNIFINNIHASINTYIKAYIDLYSVHVNVRAHILYTRRYTDT